MRSERSERRGNPMVLFRKQWDCHVATLLAMTRYYMQQFILKGLVETGQGDGAKLGVPTANLALVIAVQENMVAGLYTCQVLVGEKTFDGLVYYGVNSLTKKDCLEVHLRNFKEVLYGKEVTITTSKYLREARFFETREALQAQIKIDLQQVGWIV